MAYLRRNYKSLELVVSRRVNGSPRIRILARFKSLEELKCALRSPKYLQILRRKANDSRLSADALLDKGSQLISITKDKKNSVKGSSINTTKFEILPSSKQKKGQAIQFHFNPSDYLRYREEFEKETQLEKLLKKVIDSLEQSQNREILSEKFISLCQKFLEDQETKLNKKEFKSLRMTVFGPDDFKHDQHKYPFWSAVHGRERVSLRYLPESLITHRFSLMWDTGFSQYPGHMKYKEGRVEHFDSFVKVFAKWITNKKSSL